MHGVQLLKEGIHACESIHRQVYSPRHGLNMDTASYLRYIPNNLISTQNQYWSPILELSLMKSGA